MIGELTPVTGSPATDLSRLGLAIAEDAPMPMATAEGAEHIVRFVNPAFCRLMNQPMDQLVGRRFATLLPKHDECERLLDRVFQTGNSESYTEDEYPDLQPVFWSYTVWPVWENQRLVGVMMQVTETAQLREKTLAMNEALLLGSVRQHELTEATDRANARLKQEIHEHQQAEAALQLAQAQLLDRAGQLEGLVLQRTAELTATNKQMEAFIYSIAHDLRAPLHSMQGFSELLVAEADATLSARGRGYAERVSKSAKFMDALLRDLLNFSRVSQQHVELTPVSLEPVIASVLARLQKDIGEKRARVDHAGPWPVVRAHEPTLVQVLFNLVSNALKFVTPDVPPVVRLWPETHAGVTRVWVEDNGPGIEPEHREQIFRLFTRLESDKYAGTGIGLAIVQKGIERMGGRVGVAAAAAHGSRFWFELHQAR
jgi:signal transduction histidine kinase